MTINQRLREFFESKKIDAPTFYRSIGSERGEWSGWINTGRAISVAKIQNILNSCPDLNARWFLTGVGPMIENPANLKPYAENGIENLVEETGPSKGCLLCEEKSQRIDDLKRTITILEHQLNPK